METVAVKPYPEPDYSTEGLEQTVAKALSHLSTQLANAPNVDSEFARVWVTMLADERITADDVKLATKQALKESEYFPRIGKFLSYATEFRNERHRLWRRENLKRKALPAPITRQEREAIHAGMSEGARKLLGVVLGEA